MTQECSCGDGSVKYEVRQVEEGFKIKNLCGQCLMKMLIKDGVDIPVVMSDANAIAMWKDGDINDGEVKAEKLNGYRVEANEDEVTVMDAEGTEITNKNKDTLMVIQTGEVE